MKRIILLFISAIVFLVGCAPEAQPTSGKPVIKIGYLPITHAGPLLYDAHKHDSAFDEYELELVKFNSWADLVDALNAGQIDGASVLMQLAMQAKSIGVDINAVALGHRDGNVIIGAKDVGDVADLKGETFAIPHTHSAHHLLINELLTAEGLAYDDVNLVEMPPAEMPAALAENRIAGYAVAEPFGALAVDLDVGKVIAHSEEFWPDSYCCVLVLRDDFLNDETEIATAFFQNYVAAGKEANEKSADLYDALQNYMDIDKDVLDISLEWITYDNLQIEADEYEKLLDRVDTLELMNKAPSYEEFVDNRLFDEVD